ncbi:hypothetical protein I3842_10G033100 [Carya illinoinensis]|uniref:U3 snoRNP-associated protein-like EMB2271 n=1 Tax=Carya illinoinensis TaxID=32201 RepID=A0A922J1D1_CARIL|nr:hypothetical protein I3842_10G033100 [Carya illinoinensis]
MKKKVFTPKGGARKSKRFSRDRFFITESKKRRRKIENDGDVIDSGDSEEDYELLGSHSDKGQYGLEVEEEAETAGEKMRRLAMAYLENIWRIAAKEKENDEDGSETEGEIKINSRVSRILQRQQLERTGRVRRAIASRVQMPETTDKFQILVNHRESVTAVALSEDDSKGFSASKDGTILHWDVDSGKGEKYQWPRDQGVMVNHGAKDPKGSALRHSRHVLALAVSSDGRYLASGGLDRHIHLWDARTRQHIKAISAHSGPVSCLAFRQGTSEIFSGSFDRKIKMWNIENELLSTAENEDRGNHELFRHSSKVSTIDCLRGERVLSVCPHRMLLHKVDIKEMQTQFLARPASSALECCCFISEDEFLSGSDNGSVALWSILRQKPVQIFKNAHTLWAANQNLEQKDTEKFPYSCIEIGEQSSESSSFQSACSSWVNSVTVCRSSDLAASGAGNGFVRLWAINGSETRVMIQPLLELPLVGFVNSLAFAKSGQFLVAGVGQEPRLGRWGRIQSAQNGIALHSLKLS